MFPSESSGMQAASYIPRLWRDFVVSTPPGLVEFYLNAATQLLFFYVPATLYLFIDLAFPRFSSAHKIQSEKRQPSAAEIKHCVTTVLTGSLISSVLHLGVLYALGGPGFTYSTFTITPTLPSLPRFVGEFAAGCVGREILFYYAHRTLHLPALYARIHKKHHTFIAPIAFAAQYAHPVEHLLANVLPITLPFHLLHAHILSFVAFLGFTLYETATVHSGYDFGVPSAAHHDKHHESFRLNFGVWPWGLDYLHGTDSLPDKKTTGGKPTKRELKTE